MLTAFTQLAARLPGARLRIAGAAPKISHPQIEVLGLVPLERVPALIAQSSVLCLPSRYEPFGIVVLEAFAQKVPAVVTRVGALAHLVTDGETGRVIDPGDPAALAAALEDLLLHPEKCRACGETAHRFAAEHFTWAAVGRKLRHEIDACLEPSRAAAAQ
ncbi:MAG: glycosyltransferase family 4 protein [Chthoniobacter sp.]